jgi:hypothetical protein
VKKFLIAEQSSGQSDDESRDGQHQHERKKKGGEKRSAVDEAPVAVIKAVNFDGLFAGPMITRPRERILPFFRPSGR